jgi:hypothetical protein
VYENQINTRTTLAGYPHATYEASRGFYFLCGLHCRWDCDACHSSILAPKPKSRLHVESATGIQLMQHQKSSLTTLSPHILKTSPDHHLLQIPERNTSANKIIILRLPYGILPAIIRLEGPPDACTRASRTVAYQAAIPIQIRPSSPPRPSMNTDASKVQ